MSKYNLSIASLAMLLYGVEDVWYDTDGTCGGSGMSASCDATWESPSAHLFEEADYVYYRTVLAEECQRYGVEIWAYCLMTNHSHLVAVPDTAWSLRKAIGEAHRRYTSVVNARYHWTGHLWQGRFASYPLESTHYSHAIRYIEQNPVRAGLVQQAWDYPWSSAHVRVLGDRDPLLCPKVLAMSRRIGSPCWRPSSALIAWKLFVGIRAPDAL